ncbi:MAG: hypothetical protein ACOCW6_05405, partial [Spirochaetota bacterium]
MLRPRSRALLPALVTTLTVLALLTSCKTVDFAPRPRGPRAMAPDRAIEVVAATVPAGAPVTEIPFRAGNATRVFQAALDRAARRTDRADAAPPTVIVPSAGAPWVLETVRVPSGIRLVFEPGAEVRALRGSFKDTGQVLFELHDVHDVEILGYGATIRMWREDYQGRDYDRGQWRHIFSLRGVNNVRIAGLTLLESGGDGVYVGRSGAQSYSRDVHLLDLTIRDQHRQGVSVISAENLLIERCVLSATGGHLPMAGIDFEPNRADERFVNCVVR